MLISNKIISFLILFVFFFLPIDCEELHDACSHGDIQKVKQLIEKNPELINIKDKGLNTLLHYAAGSGKIEIVKYLIKKGVEIQARNNFGWTALHSASYHGHIGIGEILISGGISVDERDAFGWSPLFRAIQGGHESMIVFLVKKGADIDTIDRDGQTPLYLSVLKENKEITEYLLAMGAKRPIHKGDNETLLHLAAGIGNIEIVKMLLNGGEKVNTKKRFGITPLHLAAAFGRKEVINFLIDKGADVNAVSIFAGTPVFQAMVANRPEVVQMLSARGADQKKWIFPMLKGEYLGQIKPGLKPKVFASGILVNIYRPHGPIAISPDGKEIYWPASGPYGTDMKIFYMKQEDGMWTPPRIASFSTDAVSGGASISHDGRKLFFQSKLQKDTVEKSTPDSDIWEVERIDSGWGKPIKLDSLINTKYNEAFASVSKAGNLFIQADNPDKTIGGWDIYMSEKINGQYAEAINLGPAINSSYSDCVPAIAPDESYLIFHSSRPGGYGEGHELYISFRNRDGTWTPAKNMHKVINLPDTQTSSPSVSIDGKFLFFTRRRVGVFDYYWVSTEILEDLRPEYLSPGNGL